MASIAPNKDVTTADHLQLAISCPSFSFCLIGTSLQVLGWGLYIVLMLPIEWKLWYTEVTTFSSFVDVSWFKLWKAPHYFKEIF